MRSDLDSEASVQTNPSSVIPDASAPEPQFTHLYSGAGSLSSGFKGSVKCRAGAGPEAQLAPAIQQEQQTGTLEGGGGRRGETMFMPLRWGGQERP